MIFILQTVSIVTGMLRSICIVSRYIISRYVAFCSRNRKIQFSRMGGTPGRAVGLGTLVLPPTARAGKEYPAAGEGFRLQHEFTPCFTAGKIVCRVTKPDISPPWPSEVRTND